MYCISFLLLWKTGTSKTNTRTFGPFSECGIQLLCSPPADWKVEVHQSQRAAEGPARPTGILTPTRLHSLQLGWPSCPRCLWICLRIPCLWFDRFGSLLQVNTNDVMDRCRFELLPVYYRPPRLFAGFERSDRYSERILLWRNCVSGVAITLEWLLLYRYGFLVLGNGFTELLAVLAVGVDKPFTSFLFVSDVW